MALDLKSNSPVTAVAATTRGAKTLLHVCLPPGGHTKFSQIREEIGKAVDSARANAGNNGRVPDLVVLFSEEALKYRFNICKDDVQKEVEIVQQSLPQDFWVAVAFNVMLTDAKMPLNMGYLITRESYDSKPKRCYATNDKIWYELTSSIKSETDAGKKFWENNAIQLMTSLTPYPSLETPSGIKLEYRICADVQYPPIFDEPETITLVSAAGLVNSQLAALKTQRKAVILNNDYVVNSIAPPINLNKPRDRSDWKSQWIGGQLNIFHSEHLFNEDSLFADD